MPVGPDETQELLVRLEAELAEHQKVIDARLAQEDADRLALEQALEAWTLRQQKADTQLAEATPRKNAIEQRRDLLKLTGAKGNFGRAMAWSATASALFLGSTVSLALVATKPAFFVVLLLEAFGLVGGFGLVSWLSKGKDP